MPVVRFRRDPLPIDVLPLPRSPTGVGVGVGDDVTVGVGVGVGRGGLASAVGETAEQASASVMTVKVKTEPRKGFASSCLRARPIEVSISMFILSFLSIWFWFVVFSVWRADVFICIFGFAFGLFVIRYPTPGNSERSSEEFSKRLNFNSSSPIGLCERCLSHQR